MLPLKIKQPNIARFKPNKESLFCLEASDDGCLLIHTSKLISLVERSRFDIPKVEVNNFLNDVEKE